MNVPGAANFLGNLFVTDEEAREARATMEQNQRLMARCLVTRTSSSSGYLP